MKVPPLRAIAVVAVVGCAAVELVDESETEQASSMIGSSFQGSSFQGSSFQGSSFQGTSFEGAAMETVSFSNPTWGASSLSYATITNTTLSAWRYVQISRLVPGRWEQRFPDRICYWDSTRTTLTSCTTVNLATAASPLAGTNWWGTFRDKYGYPFQARIRIGKATNALAALRSDTSTAMHPLTGHAASAACPLETCEHPGSCRKNCDLWLYDIRLADQLDANGEPLRVCGTGEAMAFFGTWDAGGTWHSSTTQFTFACTDGVITKCTEWGYRPFGLAKRYGETTQTLLGPYHQACVRAASADYCGNRTSYTKTGTLIDIYDWTGAFGFIPRTNALHPSSTAFVWEGDFAPVGGTWIDHMRYQEAGGGLADLTCSNGATFSPGGTDDVRCPSQSSTCMLRDQNLDSAPVISVDSSRACAHSEHMLGKWLNEACSACTRHVPGYCSDPLDSRGWDAGCIAAAEDPAVCTAAQWMTSHSECATGAALPTYGSQCTVLVCSDPAYAGCCSSGWTSSCVAAADSKCTGGREHKTLSQFYGFCGGPIADPLPNAP